MSANHLSQRMRSSAGEVAYGAAGSGPDLVLIHGTPFSSRIWSSVIDRLSSRFRIHFLDLPGYGRSDKFEGQEVRLRSFARVLREFVEHVGLRRPHLVGHDFGAAAVLGANLIENVEVSSLTIADGVVLNPWGTDYSMLVHRNEAVFRALPSYIHRAALAAHLSTAAARPIPADLQEEFLTPWIGDVGQPAYYRQVAQYDHEYTARLETMYGRIQASTLILWGEQDRWVDVSVGQRLNQLIPGSRLEILPDAGHLSMVDCPGLFARFLGKWLLSNPARPC